MSEYAFVRSDCFYVVDIPDTMLAMHGEEKCISDNVKCNPGTIQVRRMDNIVVWQLPESQ